MGPVIRTSTNAITHTHTLIHLLFFIITEPLTPSALVVFVFLRLTALWLIVSDMTNLSSSSLYMYYTRNGNKITTQNKSTLATVVDKIF